MASENRVQTIKVAFLVCLACSVVVSMVAVLLKPVVEKNRDREMRRNVLVAAGIYRKGIDIPSAFKNIEALVVDLPTGAVLEDFSPESYSLDEVLRNPALSEQLPGDQDPAQVRRIPRPALVYLVKAADGTLQKIILPVYGMGLWSTMRGFLALEADTRTIAGLTFYEHGETPGLGGEIDNPRWQALWTGKKAFDENWLPAVTVAMGKVMPIPDEFRVDGIAGATLTSRGVQNTVRFWLGEKAFGPFLARVRAGELQ